MPATVNPLCASSAMAGLISRMHGQDKPLAFRGDVRVGVDAAAHAVLDTLDANRQRWADNKTLADQLAYARDLSRAGVDAFVNDRPLTVVRDAAIEAAARLIDAIGEIDRCIAAGKS